MDDTNFLDLCSWVGDSHPELLREAFDMWGDEVAQPLRIIGSQEPKPATVRLWDYSRKVLGKDTPNYAQQVGDCVSFGMKNACNYVQFLPILGGEFHEYHETFPPYFYGISRVQIGGTRLGLMDGSLGVWAAKGVMQYGVLRADEQGVPQYSGSLARSWGRGSGPPTSFIDLGKKHLVKSTALVTTVEQAMEAIKNGYPVTIASNWGFKMAASSDGYFAPQGSWGHQMCLTACSSGEDGKDAYFGMLNSWGEDAHGQIIDFHNGEKWPGGMLRVRAEYIGKMLAQGDSFSVSMFDIFPAQRLPSSAFEPW